MAEGTGHTHDGAKRRRTQRRRKSENRVGGLNRNAGNSNVRANMGRRKTGLMTEGSSEEEEGPLKKRERHATSDADRELGFGPYAEFTYEEVLIRKPVYVKFLVKEGKSISRKEDLLNGRRPVW